MIRTLSLLAAAGVVLTMLLIALWPARSEVGDELAFPAKDRGALDGLSFEGMLGPAGSSSNRPDVLFFNEGQFWSKSCVPCGFAPGPYRAWPTADGVRFEGTLKSPDRGRFHYAGVVRDGRVNARIKWRKERWYWTIDKDFRFDGVRASGFAPASAKQVSFLAQAARPGFSECRP